MKIRWIIAFVVIVACILIAGSARPQGQFPTLHLPDITRQISVAVEQQEKAAADVKDTQQKQAEIVKAVGDTPSVVQTAAIAKAATAVVAARETLAEVATVDPQLAAAFLTEVSENYESYQKSAREYDLTLTLIAIGGIVLSLGAGISNFMSWPKVAGILSLVVTAIIAAPKALPFEAQRSLYRALSSESYGLLVETRYDTDKSPATYRERVKKLATLQRYAQSPAGDIDAIIKKLQTDLKSK